MSSDPRDYIYVEELIPAPPRPRETRRRVTVTEGEWTPCGDPAAPGGIDGRLRAEVWVNKVAMLVEVVIEDLADAPRRRAAAGQHRSAPRLRLRGRHYVVTGLFVP